MRTVGLLLLAATASCGGCSSPEEPVPDALKASRAATPPWAAAEPQPRELATAVAEASGPAQPGKLVDAVLACRARAEARTENGSKIDLGIAIEVPSRPSVRLKGHEGKNEVEVLVPFVTLAAGDELRLHAWDEDLVDNDPIGTAVARYDGKTPIDVSVGTSVVASCVHVAPAVVEARVSKALASSTDAMPRAATLAPIAAQRHFGKRRPEVLEPRLALLDAAGWVGWTNPRVRTAVGAVDAHENALDGRYEQAVRAAFAASPALGASAVISQVTARVASPACPAGGGDVLVELTNPTKTSLYVETLAVLDDGIDEPIDSGSLEPGQALQHRAVLTAAQAASGLVRVVVRMDAARLETSALLRAR